MSIIAIHHTNKLSWLVGILIPQSAADIHNTGSPCSSLIIKAEPEVKDNQPLRPLYKEETAQTTSEENPLQILSSDDENINDTFSTQRDYTDYEIPVLDNEEDNLEQRRNIWSQQSSSTSQQSSSRRSSTYSTDLEDL